jgi:hypothetical protein
MACKTIRHYTNYAWDDDRGCYYKWFWPYQPWTAIKAYNR